MRHALALGLAALMSHAHAQDALALLPQKGTLQPIPNPTSLIARIVAKSKGIEARRSSYTYREEETEQELDRKGRVTKSDTKVYDVTFLTHGKVRRLLSVNGKPLDADAAAKEEARVLARIQALQAEEAAAADPAHQAKSKGNEINVTAADITAVCELGPISRTTFQGRRAFALGFRPKPGAKQSGLGQRLAGKLEGQLIVDEDTEQVISVDGHLTESFWVGGGLLGSITPPTTFRFEQAQVAPDLWMPVKGEFSFHARAVVVPVRMAMRFQCSDFKRFEVGEATIVKPGAGK